ncbi:MAG: saccharopine dehydrogenase NADP-binding domain-containing protein [Synergistetes bacterium]|nr:saccharopine dehydrogenase NADP-binding domain-containing protein [Synergistota bacterium]MCX8127234.1 saccharopine dehydrogenase NADP-binding domain-containing protein [Synergistota bacterium]MDW8191880.1 saccharopine dehydrogenase C-terminal domain-containing protein [Synergistota bacterium]
MKKVLLLGCGLVGKTIASELSKDFDVTVLDLNEENLNKLNERIKKVKGSAVDEELLKNLTKNVDLVCGALPGKIGYKVAQTIINLGKNYCDVSFMPENFLELERLTQERKVTAVFDMGVAPGLSNLLVGRGASLLDEVNYAKIYVGGLPEKPEPPFSYKAVFSPYDVLEEYTRPARIIVDGKESVVEALTGLEEICFPGFGKLEAFYTDGLRSLLYTIKAKNMEEKTLRYPGHANIIKALKQMKMLNEEHINLTAKLLFPLWQLEPEKGDRDITIMIVEVSGRKNGDKLTLRWELFDRFDEESWTHSMARVTAFPCVIVSKLILQEKITEKGIITPEKLGMNEEFYRYITEELRKKGIKIKEKIIIEKGD